MCQAEPEWGLTGNIIKYIDRADGLWAVPYDSGVDSGVG